MSPSDLRARCSRYFTFAQLIECGDTWHRQRAAGSPVANLPTKAATWEGISALARAILDPLHERFDSVEITYGFAAPSLTRHIPGAIAPALDQHAGAEPSPRGGPLCPRGGQACDLRVPGVSSLEVARWIRTHLPFDRLYLYGPDRALHVSHGPDDARSACAMIRRARRVVPRRLRDADWPRLEALFPPP